MIRERLIEREIGARTDFRWRSYEIARIEGLSDAVFGKVPQAPYAYRMRVNFSTKLRRSEM